LPSRLPPPPIVIILLAPHFYEFSYLELSYWLLTPQTNSTYLPLSPQKNHHHPVLFFSSLQTVTMAAIPTEYSSLVRRSHFAARQPGVIVVFCVVGSLAILLIGLWVYRKIQDKRARTLEHNMTK